MSQSQFTELQMQINQSQKPLSCMPQCQVPHSYVPLSQSQLFQPKMPRFQMPQSQMPQMFQVQKPQSQMPRSQMPRSQMPQMPQAQLPQFSMPQMPQSQTPHSQMPQSQKTQSQMPQSCQPPFCMPQLPLSQMPQSCMPQMPQAQMPQFSMPQMPQSCKSPFCMPQFCMPQSPLSQMPQSQLAHYQMQIHQSQLSQCLPTTASNLISDMVSNKCGPSQQLHKRTLLMSDWEQVQVAPVHASVDQMHRLSDHNESAYFKSRHRHDRLVPSYVSQSKAASKPAQSAWQSVSPYPSEEPPSLQELPPSADQQLLILRYLTVPIHSPDELLSRLKSRVSECSSTDHKGSTADAGTDTASSKAMGRHTGCKLAGTVDSVLDVPLVDCFDLAGQIPSASECNTKWA